MLGVAVAVTSSFARAQGATGAFPDDAPPAASPPPAAPAAPPPPAYPAPTPAPAAPPAPAAAPAPTPQPYEPAPAQPATYEPPPPPAPPAHEKSSVPPISVRIDPLNWILLGRLGIELEVGVLDWLSVETVPVFITGESPPWLNYGSSVDVTQHSNGWGPLAGATLGVNFWISGKVLKGYAIGAGITNYGLEYRTGVDSVQHTERQLYAMLNSVSRWGAFTIAGGLGLAYDINHDSRCFPPNAIGISQAGPGDCDEIQLATTNPVNLGPILIVTPYTYPWDILARFSLGVTID
jgi:hypothetical protein